MIAAAVSPVPGIGDGSGRRPGAEAPICGRHAPSSASATSRWAAAARRRSSALVARLLSRPASGPPFSAAATSDDVPRTASSSSATAATCCADLDRSGDEPLMLARARAGRCGARLRLARDGRGRSPSTRSAPPSTCSTTGFSTVAARDIDIVLVSAGDLRRSALPFGRLRDRRCARSARAHAVIVDGDADAATVAARWAPVDRPTRRSSRCGARSGPPQPLEARRRLRSRRATRAPSSRSPASPARSASREALEAAGWRVADAVAFRDHHRYTSARSSTRSRAASRETGARRCRSRPRRTPCGCCRSGRCPCRSRSVPLEVVDRARRRVSRVAAGARCAEARA